MAPQQTADVPAAGDLVVIAAHRVGEREQLGEILEVFAGQRPRYRVRWEDGHESLFFPSSDATVRRSSHRRGPS